jgi:hypothetical protein
MFRLQFKNYILGNGDPDYAFVVFFNLSTQMPEYQLKTVQFTVHQSSCYAVDKALFKKKGLVLEGTKFYVN